MLTIEERQLWTRLVNNVAKIADSLQVISECLTKNEKNNGNEENMHPVS